MAVVVISALKRQEAELPGAVLGDGVVLLDNLVAVEAEAVSHQLHDLVVGDRDMRLRPRRGFDRVQIIVRDLRRAGMRHQCREKSSFSLRLA